jgi:hypothetical protein
MRIRFPGTARRGSALQSTNTKLQLGPTEKSAKSKVRTITQISQIVRSGRKPI